MISKSVYSVLSILAAFTIVFEATAQTEIELINSLNQLSLENAERLDMRPTFDEETWYVLELGINEIQITEYSEGLSAAEHASSIFRASIGDIDVMRFDGTHIWLQCRAEQDCFTVAIKATLDGEGGEEPFVYENEMHVSEGSYGIHNGNATALLATVFQGLEHFWSLKGFELRLRGAELF